MSKRGRDAYLHEIRAVPELGEVIDELENIADLQKKVRAIFGSDDPAEIEKLVGTEVGGQTVSRESVEHAVALAKAHATLKTRFADILAEIRLKR